MLSDVGINDALNVDDLDLGGAGAGGCAGAVGVARALEGEALLDGALEQMEVPLNEEDVRHQVLIEVRAQAVDEPASHRERPLVARRRARKRQVERCDHGQQGVR